jgi:acetylglutamate kinase
MKSTLVIKVGGELLNHSLMADKLFKVLAQLQQKHHLVLVHGGGSLVQDWLTKLQLESHKIDGIRVTPTSHIPYVVGALAGTANKTLVTMAQLGGLSAVGISLSDGELVNAALLDPKLGAVGKVEPKNDTLLRCLLQAGFFPIVSTIAQAQTGQLLNVNADDGAVAVAKLLDAQLIFLSDVVGVLDKQKNCIPLLTALDIQHLITEDVIQGGMIAKVHAAHSAAVYLKRQVMIAGWQTPEHLLNLDEDSGNVGTCICP